MKSKNERWHTSSAFWEKLKPKAREMRANPTEAELLLWQYLRDGKFKRFKFRRQHSLGQFVVDFYCRQAKLVIEVDGPIHRQQKEKDDARQEYLELRNYTVLRLTNEMVLKSTGHVINQINAFLINR